MTQATLKQRIVGLVGKAVLGAPPRQIDRLKSEASQPPAGDAILDARQTAQDFAARLVEIMHARDTFDQATARFRGSKHLDFASLVAAGQPLPEIEGFEIDARRAEARLNALRTLADREAERANAAVLTLRRSARSNIDAAEKAARAAVRDMLPGLFADADTDAVVERARPVKEVARAIEELDRLASAGIPIRNAEMFGFTLPQFRTCALPERGMPGIEHHDRFNPATVIADIRRVLEIQIRTSGFNAAMNSEPIAARWS